MGRWLMFTLAALLLLIGLGRAGDRDQGDLVRQELKGLEGAWTLESYEYEGKRLSRKATIKAFGGEDRLNEIRIEGDKIIWVWWDYSTEYTLLAGGKPRQGTYSLNP